MKRSDADSLVCATDAGREGELIFRLVYHQAGCRKPFEKGPWYSRYGDRVVVRTDCETQQGDIVVALTGESESTLKGFGGIDDETGCVSPIPGHMP